MKYDIDKINRAVVVYVVWSV